jgi:hypothetical protein
MWKSLASLVGGLTLAVLLLMPSTKALSNIMSPIPGGGRSYAGSYYPQRTQRTMPQYRSYSRCNCIYHPILLDGCIPRYTPTKSTKPDTTSTTPPDTTEQKSEGSGAPYYDEDGGDF